MSCGNVFDIVRGESPYRSLRQFVEEHPVFVAFRREQEGIADRSRPCLLLDHPEAFRRIARIEGCRAAKNMAEGYLDGAIARAVDEVAAEWRRKARELPSLPGVRA